MAIFEQVKEVICRESGVPASWVTEIATLEGDLKQDSLKLVELFMALDTEFGIVIDEDDQQKLAGGTVGDIVAFIEGVTGNV